MKSLLQLSFCMFLIGSWISKTTSQQMTADRLIDMTQEALDFCNEEMGLNIQVDPADILLQFVKFDVANSSLMCFIRCVDRALKMEYDMFFDLPYVRYIGDFFISEKSISSKCNWNIPTIIYCTSKAEIYPNNVSQGCLRTKIKYTCLQAMTNCA